MMMMMAERATIHSAVYEKAGRVEFGGGGSVIRGISRREAAARSAAANAVGPRGFFDLDAMDLADGIAVDADADVVETDAAGRPAGGESAVVVGADEHLLRGPLDRRRGEPQFLEGIVLVRLHDANGRVRHLVLDCHFVGNV